MFHFGSTKSFIHCFSINFSWNVGCLAGVVVGLPHRLNWFTTAVVLLIFFLSLKLMVRGRRKPRDQSKWDQLADTLFIAACNTEVVELGHLMEVLDEDAAVAADKGLAPLPTEAIDDPTEVMDPFQRDELSSYLLVAASKGEVDTVQALITAGAEVDKSDSGGNTALMMAALRGHADVANCLLKAGASIDRACQSGFTALRLASQCGHSSVVVVLLNAGANFNPTDDLNWPHPLGLAANSGHLETVKILVVKARPHLYTPGIGDNALKWAARGGHTEVVRCLLEAAVGPDWDIIRDSYPLLLLGACQHGFLDVVQLLLSAQTHETGSVLWSPEDLPIGFAAKSGHLEVVKCLVSAGANINQPSSFGLPLSRAWHSGHVDVVEYLFKLGAIADHTVEVECGSILQSFALFSQIPQPVVLKLLSSRLGLL